MGIVLGLAVAQVRLAEPSALAEPDTAPPAAALRGGCCIGDADCNGLVNFADITATLANFGNVCVVDSDGDGVADSADNCPLFPNPDQTDTDADGVGDACDNCPFIPNPSQQDSDNDQIGDACEGVDLDQDGWSTPQDCDDTNAFIFPGAMENCSDGLDNNCNGFVDANDPACAPPGDADMDGVPDQLDNCPATPNPTQSDLDADGDGDACDNCPTQSDPSQADFDSDGVGDVCDICPFHFNPGQEDANMNFIGDACESTADDDGDGWPAGLECNDGNPQVYPNAPEICDGLDNDCDGMIDEGC